MSRFAVIAAVFLGCAAVGTSGSARAEEASSPQVTGKLAKTFKAAQDAMQAKNYTEALAKLKELQATQGRSAYDDYVINAWLLQTYGATGDNANAAVAAEAMAASSYTNAETRAKIYVSLGGTAYNAKEYPRAIEMFDKARAAGDTSDGTAMMIAQSYYLDGKYKDAISALNALNERAQAAGKKPSENSLKILWDSALKSKDEASAAKAVEQLILLYPKPEYWQTVMANSLNNLSDDRVKAMTYRLALQVGTLKQGERYREMAQILNDQGNSGEAQTVMEQAFAKNLFTEARDKDSNNRLLEMTRKKAAADKLTIAKDEAQAATLPNGDGLVQIGAAYLGFGQVDKGIAAINAGIAKGNLKYPDEAWLLLGIGYEKARNNGEAIKAFEKVTKDPRYQRLAHLWILEVKG